VQNGWSASINSNGGFFCEVAAALSLLFGIKVGWEIKPSWWEKIPKDFARQMESLCVHCGCAMPLKKRYSVEKVDDISPKIYESIKDISPKVKRGDYAIHNLRCAMDNRTSATYKDEQYRAKIAARYGMFLVVNERGFQTPYLRSKWNANNNVEKGKYDGGAQTRQNAV
jgi:hypothetical protein